MSGDGYGMRSWPRLRRRPLYRRWSTRRSCGGRVAGRWSFGERRCRVHVCGAPLRRRVRRRRLFLPRGERVLRADRRGRVLRRIRDVHDERHRQPRLRGVHLQTSAPRCRRALLWERRVLLREERQLLCARQRRRLLRRRSCRLLLSDVSRTAVAGPARGEALRALGFASVVARRPVAEQVALVRLLAVLVTGVTRLREDGTRRELRARPAMRGTMSAGGCGRCFGRRRRRRGRSWGWGRRSTSDDASNGEETYRDDRAAHASRITHYGRTPR